MGDFVCKMLHHMDEKGVSEVNIVVPAGLAGAELMPWIEDDNFNPGYLTRDMDKMPKRVGEHPEWRHTQDYFREVIDFPAINLDGEEFAYR
jgi:hypothetical protein